MANHAYDNNCDTSCNVCGFTRTTSHTYDSGTVTKEPTESAEGEKTFTCTLCGSTKTEAIPRLDEPVSDTSTPETSTSDDITTDVSETKPPVSDVTTTDAPETTDKTENNKDGFDVTIVIVGVISAIVGAGIGSAVTTVIFKKKK